MVEKTIELTEEQLEKVETLEANGINVGEAIDMLFKIKEDVEVNAPKYENEIDVISKLKDTTLDVEQKREILEKDYSDLKTYDDQTQAFKRNISWARDFFKF